MDSPSNSSIKTIVQELGERQCAKHPQERFVSCPLCLATEQARRETERRVKLEKERQEAPALMRRHLEMFGIPMRYRGLRLADYHATSPAQQAVLETARLFAWHAHPDSGSEDDAVVNAHTIKHRTVENGLLMLGNVGTGKTLLACAILTDETHTTDGDYLQDGLYLTAMQLLRMIKATWAKESKDTEQSVLKKLSTVDLLVIDEIGIQFNSDTERLILTEVINDRYNACVPTILVSNLTLAEFQQVMGERVVDRFRDGGKVLVFDWPSQRGKAQVIHSDVKPEPLEIIDRAI